MDIKHKLKIVETAIRSISTHDDEDSVVIGVALNRIVDMVEIERRRIADKHAEAAAALNDRSKGAERV